MVGQHAYTLAHTSTPLMGSAPPLATPAPYHATLPQGAAPPHLLTVDGQYSPDPQYKYMHPATSQEPTQAQLPSTSHPYQPQLSTLAGSTIHPHPYPHQLGRFEERGETEGGNDQMPAYFDPLDMGSMFPHPPQHPAMAMYGPHPHDQVVDSGYHGNTNYGIPSDQPTNYYPANTYSPGSQTSVPPIPVHGVKEDTATYQNTYAASETVAHATLPQIASPAHDIETYKVQYMGGGGGGTETAPPQDDTDKPDHIPPEPRLSPSAKEFEQLQTEFINQGLYFMYFNRFLVHQSKVGKWLRICWFLKCGNPDYQKALLGDIPLKNEAGDWNVIIKPGEGIIFN